MTMRDCCKETYKKTLEEVIFHIKKVNHKSFAELIGTLQYAVSMLEEKKPEIGPIIFNEWNPKMAFWKCWICGEMRPDKFISVKVHDISKEKGCDQMGIININVKYCNDREVCTGDAHIKEIWLDWPMRKK